MHELSIVIPTKNRQDTAIEAVRLASRIGTPSEVEVVVQDCSTDAHLADMLAAAQLWDRVSYQHTDENLSMTGNWNRALARTQGEYVIVIGDDDSVSPDLLGIVRWAREHDLDAVKGAQYACYWYPNFADAALAGTLFLPHYSGKATVFHDSESELREHVTTGDAYASLPMIYHNIVRRSVLERVRATSGTFVGGISPDIYSAFAIACVIGRYAVVDYPLSLLGASVLSNSNRVRTGLIHRHYREFPDYRFTWMAPESFELVATNMDNMVRALENMGREDLLRQVDYRRVFARTIVGEPRRAWMHFRKFLQVSRRMRGSSLAAGVGLIAAIAVKVGLKTVRQIRDVLGLQKRSNGETVRHVDSLGAALEHQTRWLAEHEVQLVNES